MRTTLSLSCLVLVLTTAATAQDAPAPDVTGDWAGWAYLHEGGDLPLRVRFALDDGELTGTLGAPSQRAVGLALDSVDVDRQTVTFVRVNSAGTRFVYTGTLDGHRMFGETTIDGQPAFDFEFNRAAVALPHVDPDAIADLTGLYRAQDGRTFLVSSWFWGELIFDDPANGRRLTMFATSPDAFVIGRTPYDPSEVTGHLTFNRQPKAGRTTLTLADAAGRAITAERFELPETEVSFASGDVPMQGVLIRPDSPGPHPAVVVLGGSDWATRESTRSFAERFAAMGVAALCFDKRGHGDSGGTTPAAFRQIADDALAAVQHLRQRDDIRSDQVGLFGVSRGGWHAPLAASLSHDVSFLVVFVAPAISPEAQETTRRLNELRRRTSSPEEMALAERYLEAQFEFAASGDGWNDYERLRREVDDRGWLDVLQGPAERDPEQWQWARLNMRYDPVPALSQISCPVLAVFGGADDNVVPADNVPVWRTALTQAPTDEFLLHVVPMANHGFQLVPEEGATYRVHDAPGRAPGVWPMVDRWIGARGEGRGTSD